MEDVARYGCVYNRNSIRISNTKTKRLTVEEKSARNLIFLASS